MPIDLIDVRPVTADAWDRLVASCPHATYFHTRQWSEVWARYSGGQMRPDARLITCSDGVEVLLPLTHRRSRKGLVQGWLSSPAATYGGWIAPPGFSVEHGAALLRFLHVQFDNLVLRLSPFDPVASLLLGPSDVGEATWVLDLRQEEAQLEAAMRRKQIQRKVRTAENYGLALVPLGVQDLESLYTIYRDCLLRWPRARQVYDIELFQGLIESSGVDFWGVRGPRDEVVAVTLVLKAARHVVPWVAYARSEALPLRPNELMFYELIRHYRQLGFFWFDFNPSGGQEGVERFKRSFGAERRSCPLLVRESVWAHALGQVAGVLRG